MFKRLLLSSLLLVAMLTGVQAQVTIIDPTTNNGGFESATAVPWQIVNGTQTNKWIIGTGATSGFSGTRSAYISNGTGTAPAHTYTFSSGSSVFLYQDVALPAGYPVLTLTFKAIQKGENNYDQALVYMSTGTPGAAPSAGTSTTTIAALPALACYQQLFLVPVQTTAGWTTYTVSIPASLAGNAATGTTRRLLFRWVNDGSGGTNPPIGLDDVTLTAACGGPTVTVANQTTSDATLYWTAIPGATSYQVRYRLSTDPVTAPSWATPTTVTTTNLTLSGLNADAYYIYEVNAVNGSCTTPDGGTFYQPCSISTLPYSEDFESITANNTLPTCMKGITLGTDVLSFIANQATYNRTNHTPGGSKFGSFRYGTNNRYLFTPGFELDTATTYKVTFWYVADGASGFDTLRAVLANSPKEADITVLGTAVTNVNNTVYRQYTAQIKPARSGVQYFGISVKGNGSPWYLTVDDININPLTPCTGAPAIGAITGPSGICANQGFTLTANGYNTNLSGTSLQWQSANSCSGPWMDIAGQTGPTYTVAGGIATSMAYRVVLNCANSGNSGISPCFPVTVNSFYNCYCTSAAGNAVNEDIAQVQIGGFFTNPAVSPAPPLTNNPLATGTYSDYTNLPPILLSQGANYPLDVTQFSSSTLGANTLKAFIDYNHNSLLNDAGETIATIASPANNPNIPSHSGNFTVPATAQVGITRMRLVLARTTAAASVTPCAAYGSGETEDYLVEITGTPVPPSLTSNGPVCGGDSVTIVANANILTSSPLNAAQYTLTGPGISPITNISGIFRIPVPRAVSTVRYIVSVKAYGVNSDTTGINVIVYPNPALTLGTVTNPTTCAGTDGSIQINGLGNTMTYALRYRRNGVLVNVPSITSDAAGSYVLSGLNVATYDSIRIVSTNCPTNFVGPVSLVAPGAPATPNATANSPICLSGTLTLTVQNPDASGTYNWFGPNGFSATGVTATRNNLGYADTGRYYVTVTIAGCTSLPRAIRATLTPPSAAPTVLAQNFCQGIPATPLMPTGGTLLWYTTATGGTGVPSITPNTITAGTFTYYVTQSPTGCPNVPRTPVVVTVVPQPLAPRLPYDTVLYCQFQAPTRLLAYGINTKFYTTATGGIGVAVLTPSTSVPGTTTYYATQSIGGCESRRVPIIVIVSPKPAPPVVSSPVNLCQFTTPLPLTATGQDLLWYNVPTGGTGMPTPPSPPTGYEATMTYYVVQTLNGCESDRAAIQVNVNYAPNATFVPSKNYVCVEDTISFVYFGNARPDAKYYWTIPSPSGHPVSGMGTQGPFVARFDSVGTYQVRLVVDNKGCISPPVYQNFEVRPRPDVRITGKREICLDEITELTLDSISDSISSYNWVFGDGIVVYGTQNTGPYGVKWTTPGLKEVIVRTVSRQCGSFDRKEPIIVRPAPAANIRNKPTAAVCSGDSIRLQATDLGPGYSYQWSPAGLFRSDERGGTSVWAIAPTGTNTTYIELKATDTFGCKGVDYLYLATQPCCTVLFPNAFTPNSDGKNDVFGMITNGTPTISAFRIFNRVGNMVFETSNPLRGWDGTFMSQPQPTDVYYYHVRYRCDGKEFEQKGEVTLIR